MDFIERGNYLSKAFFPALIFLIGGLFFNLQAQTKVAQKIEIDGQKTERQPIVRLASAEKSAGETSGNKPILVSVLPNYYDAQDGVSINELIERALVSNQDLAATRLEIEKAKARLNQAYLRPNPTLEFEQESERLVSSGNDRLFTVGASLPIEIYGRREARINVANIGIQASEAEVRNRERILVANILTNYSEALAALRELEATENLLELDLQTTRFVQIRVTEGKTAPLEENMTLVEVNRLRSVRETEAGNTEISLLELRNLLGMKPEEPLRLDGDFKDLLAPVSTVFEATQQALQTRPDLLAMKSLETLAEANIEQARANGRIDASLSAGYGRNSFGFPVNGITDTGALRPVQDVFHSFKFGITLEIPVRNRNQGAIEAAVANSEAASKRFEFAELTVRREVAAAFTRYKSAARAMEIFRVGVRDQAILNLDVVRQTYELGARNLIDYLVEERRFIELENEFIDAQLAVYRARVEILQATNAPELMTK